MSEIEFPDEIPNEDMDLIFKEWRLAGVDCVFTGKYGVIFKVTPDSHYCGVVYEPKEGAWRRMTSGMLDRLCAQNVAVCPLGVGDMCFREDR